MDNAVIQSQGHLLCDVNYFQQRWSHSHKAKGDKMKNLINYITSMNVEYKVNTRLDMLALDGSPGHIHMINYLPNTEMKSSSMQSSNQMQNQAVSKN